MLILFSSFRFFVPLGSGEGRIVDRQANAGKRCTFFSFFFWQESDLLSRQSSAFYLGSLGLGYGGS